MVSEQPLSSPVEAKSGLVEVTKDTIYYFHLVTFEVDGCLFRVPSLMFERDSDYFREMLKSRIDKRAEEDNPIKLDSVSKEDFRSLLSFLYPVDPKKSPSVATLEQCVSLLDITNKWGFHEIHRYLSDKISGLWNDTGAFDKVRIVRAYNLTDRYEKAFYELVRRDDPLSLEEAQVLGLEFTVKMAEARERCRTSFCGCQLEKLCED